MTNCCAKLFSVLGFITLGLIDTVSAEPAAIDRSAILLMMQEQGLDVGDQLDLPGGVEAYAVRAGTQPFAVFLLPGNEYAIVGTLVDASGQDVSGPLLAEVAGEGIKAEVLGQLEAATWVRDGAADAPRIVYTFTDPNCPYCNRFWLAARPWIDAGKVQLRHVMVGVIRPNSAAKAAAILEDENPAAALTLNETRHGDGGIAPLDQISPDTLAAIEANAELMRELGFGGTPAIVYENPDGTLGRHSGMPQGDDLNLVLGAR
ncbi:thiol:disulfide interchange protein DsbG [Devosia epidermidihirudinis]|uniref:thiol:disulfide interchange protein DsbG n=1 Tax=Devosia epidermidihirudinis TaxID=1293439 RepID=UPI0006960A60|nr:thiol:disulfide interchange protein DsbG [Devosia epidermidihirudinis]